MSKKVLICIALISMCFVTGCGKEEVKEMTCTRTATITKGVELDLNYKVTYKGDYVQLVESTEKVISDDEEYLKTYETTVNNLYSPYSDIEYYEYDVKIDGNTLVSTSKINYEKIDTDKMIKIDSANASLIKDGKVKLSDIQAVYEANGATCK